MKRLTFLTTMFGLGMAKAATTRKPSEQIRLMEPGKPTGMIGCIMTGGASFKMDELEKAETLAGEYGEWAFKENGQAVRPVYSDQNKTNQVGWIVWPCTCVGNDGCGYTQDEWNAMGIYHV